MGYTEKCPMCGKEHNVQDSDFGRTYYCSEEIRFVLHEDLFEGKDKLTQERWLNAIYNYVFNSPRKDKNGRKWYWKFYYDESEQVYDDDCLINVYQLMKSYPKNVIERIDKSLLNLSKTYPFLSDTFGLYKASELRRLFYCESDNYYEEEKSIFSALLKMNYIEESHDAGDIETSDFRIAIEGWKRIAELTKHNSTTKYGFIAMSFDEDVAYIGNAFKQAIQKAGYEPRIIKDKEHNNYIMPEIFHEIEQSRFVVVDITKPNNGAYYEAGYAQALGKEVIVCCKKDIFDDKDKKPHFDIAQKSMIIWKDENDLIERLNRRIYATVK